MDIFSLGESFHLSSSKKISILLKLRNPQQIGQSMSETITCEEAKRGLEKLQTLERELSAHLDYASSGAESAEAAREAVKRASVLRLEIEQGIDTLKEQLNPLEREFGLKDQYEKQLQVLRTAGILEKFKSGKEGIRAIEVDGDVVEYPIPTLEEVTQRLKGLETEYGKGFLEKKREQGFCRLLLVPFGMSLDSLMEAYERVLRDHHARNAVFYTKKDPSEPNALVDLDTSEPVWIWKEGYENGDIEGKIVYEVQQFDTANHGGKTKTEILQERKKQTADGKKGKNGWDVLLLEKEINIPRSGKGKDLGAPAQTRKQLEAGKQPKQYLEFLLKNKKDTNSVYHGEQGLRPEEWLMLAITYLEQENQIIDDWQGNGSASFNVGAFFPASSYVPSASFYRDYRQSSLRSFYPDNQYDDIGVRSGVRG